MFDYFSSNLDFLSFSPEGGAEIKGCRRELITMILCYSQTLVAASSDQTRKRGNSYSEHTLSRGHGHEIDQLAKGKGNQEGGIAHSWTHQPCTILAVERDPVLLLVNGIIGWAAASISSRAKFYQRVGPIKHLLPSFHQIESSTQTALSPDIPLSRRRRRRRRVANFLPRPTTALVKGRSSFIKGHCWRHPISTSSQLAPPSDLFYRRATVDPAWAPISLIALKLLSNEGIENYSGEYLCPDLDIN